MIEEEVRIGVPSGRIFDIMGSELRFGTSSKLIKRFMDEKYCPMIKKLTEKKELFDKPGGNLSREGGGYLLLQSV